MQPQGALDYFGSEYTVDPSYVYGIPNPPALPQGADVSQAPATPVPGQGMASANLGSIGSALHQGANVTAGPVWRQPAFMALLVMAIGVMLIGSAAHVAAKA